MSRRYEENERERSVDRKRNRFIQENDWMKNVEDFLKKKELKNISQDYLKEEMHSSNLKRNQPANPDTRGSGNERRKEDKMAGYQSGSDSSKGKEKRAITFPEYKSYQEQVNQLMDVKMKMEFQLLKLKQDREALKEEGAKHEDNVMKENAGMQRGLKAQLEMTADNLVRLQTFLASCELVRDVPAVKKREEEVQIKNRRSESRDSSDEKEKKKKKKKQRSRSSSEEESEESEDKKKKKKRKKDKQRARDSSKSDDSEMEKNKSSSDEEDSDRTREKKKKKKKKKQKQKQKQDSDDSEAQSDQDKKVKSKERDEEASLMGILAKVSAAYSKLKAENAELNKTVQVLEIENSALKEILSQVKERRGKNDVEKVDDREKMKSNKNDLESDDKGKYKINKNESEVEERGRNKSSKRDSTKVKDTGNRWREEEEEHSKSKKTENDEMDLDSIDLPEYDEPFLKPSEERKISILPDVDDDDEEELSDRKESRAGAYRYPEEVSKIRKEKVQEWLQKKNRKATQSWEGKEGQRAKEELKQVEENRNKEKDRSEEKKYYKESSQHSDSRDHSLSKRFSEKEKSPERPKKEKRTYADFKDKIEDFDRKYEEEKSTKRHRESEDESRDYYKKVFYDGEREERSRYNSYQGKDRNGDGYEENYYDQRKKHQIKDDYYESYPRENNRGRDYESRERDRSESREYRKRSKEGKDRRRSRSKRSRSRSEERRSSRDSPKKSKSQARLIDDRSERICLEEWTPKMSILNQDPTIVSLKKKMKLKEDEEEETRKRKLEEAEAEEEEERKRKEFEEKDSLKDIPPPPPPVEQPPRNPVAIQWGNSIKTRKTPEKNLAAKKLTAFVGKMPGKGLKKITPDHDLVPEKISIPSPPPPSIPKPATPPPPPVRTPAISIKTSSNSKFDLKQILEAAQAHIRNRNSQDRSSRERSVEAREIEIPLPPLPAAQDKDPEALMDTRPAAKAKKSEMDLLIEQHKNETSEYDVMPPTYLPPPPVYNTYQNSYHQSAAQYWTPVYQQVNPQMEPEVDLARISPPREVEDPDLAMLGIDPNDLAGFGN